MAANRTPIFGLTPNIGAVNVTAANTANTGTGTIGTDIFKLFTAGADGAWISKVSFNPVASVAATATTATVARLYKSTQTSGATVGGTDTFFIGEVALPSQTADATTAPTVSPSIVCNFALEAGETLLVSTHAAPAANTGQQAIAFGVDY